MSHVGQGLVAPVIKLRHKVRRFIAVLEGLVASFVALAKPYHNHGNRSVDFAHQCHLMVAFRNGCLVNADRINPERGLWRASREARQDLGRILGHVNPCVAATDIMLACIGGAPDV